MILISCSKAISSVIAGYSLVCFNVYEVLNQCRYPNVSSSDNIPRDMSYRLLVTHRHFGCCIAYKCCRQQRGRWTPSAWVSSLEFASSFSWPFSSSFAGKSTNFWSTRSDFISRTSSTTASAPFAWIRTRTSRIRTAATSTATSV